MKWAMHHFFHILSLPDNIPIIMLMASVIYLTYLSFKEARANDKLTEAGKADEIYRRMIE